MLSKVTKIMDITDCISSKGYSLLHTAVFRDFDDIVACLCTAVMKSAFIPEDKRQVTLKAWINTPTQGDEGYQAMHFASFNGNLNIIRFLRKHGGDIHAMNNQRLNMLHCAAQGNQPTSIVYFVNEGFNVNDSRDTVNSTPLHWACYQGAQASVAYLLSAGSDPNKQDVGGNTPLHLSVKSVTNT